MRTQVSTQVRNKYRKYISRKPTIKCVWGMISANGLQMATSFFYQPKVLSIFF